MALQATTEGSLLDKARWKRLSELMINIATPTYWVTLPSHPRLLVKQNIKLVWPYCGTSYVCNV